MNKRQKQKIIGTLEAEIKESFDRIDQLEAENEHGLPHTIARERLYASLKMVDILKECKPFYLWEFDQLTKLVGERVRPNNVLKYGWFGHI